MQHTVLAFFDTYPQAEAARDALVAAGIAQQDVMLKARCEPTYASDATSAVDSAPTANEGLLASIERFFESLFTTAPPESESLRYAEAVRRGAVMVCVDAPTDALAQLTRSTLETMGPLDIEERAATWHAPTDEATRAHSPLEELGFRASVPAATPSQSPVRSYIRGASAPPPAPEAGDATSTGQTVTTEAAATAVAAGSAPGMGAVFAAGAKDPAATPASAPMRPAPVPDPQVRDAEGDLGDQPPSNPR